ncbi:lycopene cyclase domain-containing protein [Ornithinimicrobium sp. F0845]|uniref:lycopene cyclase domain-containing protein n=1 Tax=Ornithinimicrobium sp. F0845 TaxID=2926412 RepID=UPI001FF3248C|nr:lycopene cyclase domain-containing protein [Ornithinimicrobium sp. F0845]MCK0113087.1 lycopene cyclase domain-containing protein [Ornithinimicrobium sp. F0845]
MSYAGLAVVFVALSAAVALLATVRRGLGARWWLTTGVTIIVLLVLTVVFDSVMILADLFRFDESSLLGVRLWRAPVEDLAWPLAAGLLLPSLRELLTAPPEVP